MNNESFISTFSKNGIDSLRGQFILHKDTKVEQKNWNHLFVNGWLLETHPSLNTIRVLFNEVPVGIIVGYPIYERKFLSTDEQIRIVGDNFSKLCFEKLIKCTLGRYVALLLTDSLEFFYPDAVATLSTVYDIKNQYLASSTILFPVQSRELNESLVNTCKLSETIKGSYYPCGLTYFDNLKVLKPNFCINLRQMSEERFEFFEIGREIFDFNEVAYCVANEIQDITGSILRGLPVEVFLTAGKDSRLLLASLREKCKEVIYSTYYENAVTGSHYINFEIASLIARDLDLNYSSHDLSKKFQFTTNSNNVVILGYGGELSRGYLWKKDIINSPKISIESIIRLLGYPNNDIICAEIDKWLSFYSSNNTTDILDFLYVEQYMGHLTSPSLYRYDCVSKFSIAPLCSWNIVNKFLNLSMEVKSNDKFTRRFLNEFMPSLNSYIFA
ncbi:MAG: hypothetical protein WCK82_09040 [Bacteroidota bacterium]